MQFYRLLVAAVPLALALPAPLTWADNPGQGDYGGGGGTTVATPATLGSTPILNAGSFTPVSTEGEMVETVAVKATTGEAKKSACEKATAEAEKSGSASDRVKANNACKVDYTVPGGTQSAAQAESPFKNLSNDTQKAMLSEQFVGASGDNINYQNVTTAQQVVKADPTVRLSGMDSNIAFNSAFAANTRSANVDQLLGGVGTTLSRQEVKDWYARYDPAKVVIAGSGSGMVRCSGGGSACPGGKWGVDGNDGSIQTSMGMARTSTFTPTGQENTRGNGLDAGYLVPTDGSVPEGTTSAMLQTARAVDEYGIAIGAPAEVRQTVIGTIYRESKFNTATGPGSSSAWGYGQYVGDTWLASADGQNRNNSFSQMDVLYSDTMDRYTTYTNSPNMQKAYGNFGTYDYVIHHDGNALLSRNHSFAVNYYQRTADAGNALYAYTESTLGSSGAGVVVDRGAGVGGLATGGVNTVSVGGALGAVLADLKSANLSTGNTLLDSVLGLGGQGGLQGGLSAQQGQNAALLAQLQQLQNGGASGSGGSDGTASSGGDEGADAATTATTVTTTEKTWSCDGGTVTSSSDSAIDGHSGCTLTSVTTKVREGDTTTTTTEYLSAASEEPAAEDAGGEDGE